MSTIPHKRLPAKIQELRQNRNLTQKQMAQTLALSEGQYSRIESGKRTIQQNQIDVLAHILDADVKELRSLYLADKFEIEAHEFSDEEINQALKVLNNKLD